MILESTRRLLLEKILMAREMPQFSLFSMGEDSYFEGWQFTSNGSFYRLKIVLSEWYPDHLPNMYVTSPSVLRKYDGTILNSDGTSHAFHTLSNGPGGYLQICHFGPLNWDASKTCVGVATKGILWLEAYTRHLATGMTIAEILEGWKRGKPKKTLTTF
jgi:hypothetical protein